MKHDEDGIFTGRTYSMSDILPCPRCYSLDCKNAPSHNCAYYEKRYQCRKCGQFFRLDTRPPEDNPVDWNSKEKMNIILPAK